jgi:hypothetical protein
MWPDRGLNRHYAGRRINHPNLARRKHHNRLHATAVPVIRDGEGGVLKHPRAVRQAQQVIVSGVWQIAISAVERLRSRTPRAGYRWRWRARWHDRR